eukprot:CAMPEP_0197828990 /NCGR_PEP_ID=MMETSP1437-20131217/5470_1 /TAXON_ID=49252 ORGANISM="Eucampia antarctica, Strain CCMP1452" /NCGR_SAMPLE_ID=MMETSP1437 /ASSEMBLY_ACC=CAM_ASM_001096 /LENGTH=241 /DNA_ID=CAMNT_0043430433 /DNA_START=187 /DNA_END=912 /DNA_ORIENTATION=+
MVMEAISRKRQRRRNSNNGDNESEGSILDKHEDGDIFELNKFTGKVEFGNTGSADVTLDEGDEESITRWLQDTKQVALSIWDKDMIRELGDNVFRLELMALQLVTIQLKPSVDVKMWTETTAVEDDDDGSDGGSSTVFKMQSVGFNPNIQVLPFIGLPKDALKLTIEVAGELYPAKDGKGLSGRIGFVSTGDLPPPMRIIPEPVLKAAITTINRTVSAFAIMSFQKGVTQNFRNFVRSSEK